MIKPEDRKLLRVGDAIYSWRTCGVGNTTLRARSIYTTEITAVEVDGTIWGSWNGNKSKAIKYGWGRYFLHHPKPHRSAWRWEHSDGYERECARAAAVAAASRAEWRNRRRAAKKEPTNA